MSKYIFATKFKKIEKEPLYYNIQVSVDKDWTYSGGGAMRAVPHPGSEEIHFYKDSPIMLHFTTVNTFGDVAWYADENREIGIYTPTSHTNFYLCYMPYFNICEGPYPLPEIISILDKSTGTTFTFTPIPVYEKENYNLEVLFDKDLRTYDIDGQIKDFEANSPIILNYAGPDTWTYGNSLSFERKEDSYTFNGIDSNRNIQTYVSFPSNGINLTDPYDAVYYTNEDGITFKFKLVHIYE